MAFEPIYKKIIKELEAEGRVTTLSKEATYKIDNELAIHFAPVKEEFYRKERASRYYANKLESVSVEI
jgi:hypothetical protein